MRVFFKFFFLFSIFIFLSFNKGEEYTDKSDFKPYHENIIDGFIWHRYNLQNLRPIEDLNPSEECRNLIIKYEGLRLKAYSVGDGMITIGFGHAELESSSSFKLGDEISMEEAIILFDRDLRRKEFFIKSLFRSWEDESGKKIYITQSMFDAILSLTYNIGVGGFMDSGVAKNLKRRDYIGAAESIKITKLNPKFPMLEDRRIDESNLFLKDYLISR